METEVPSHRESPAPLEEPAPYTPERPTIAEPENGNDDKDNGGVAPNVPQTPMVAPVLAAPSPARPLSESPGKRIIDGGLGDRQSPLYQYPRQKLAITVLVKSRKSTSCFRAL